jgi:DNA-binding transcriptional ArsR family regulator
MIRLSLSTGDLSATRLTYSPLWESVLSYRGLSRPAPQRLPVPWTVQLSRDASRLDLRPLAAALADHRVLFDFLFPVPDGPDALFSDQVDQLRACAPDDVAGEIERHYGGMGETPPPPLRPFVDRPRHSIDRLASALISYWDRAFRPHWPRVRAALESDLLHRSRILAAGGAERMLQGLHPDVRWRDGGLDLDRPFEWDVEAERPGVMVVPTAFGWPNVIGGTMEGVKLVAYPARGLGALWEQHPPGRHEAAEALLGSTRARVTLALRAPMATSDLAAVLGVGGSSVSYHLGHLRRAGIVEWHREGRRVVYRLSSLGTGLLRLWDLDAPDDAGSDDEAYRPA